jgi:hypothetical protein
MPEIARFFGIIIRMYAEPGAPHHSSHFHAYYQDEVAVYSIDPIDLIGGSLPRRQQRLVEAWAELHQIDFEPVLAGELYGALRDPSQFSQVRIDPEVHTLVWPNGADFDPATLHDWPKYSEDMTELAKRWAAASN